YRHTTALAVHSYAPPPSQAMVERPEFFPRFLRTSVFRFRDLARAVPAQGPEPPALVVGPVVLGVRTVCAHRRSTGRRTFPFSFIVVDRTGRLDRALSR